MDESNKREFASIMRAMGAIYDIDFTQTLLGIWFDALKDRRINEIAAGVSRYIKSPDFGSYKPKPADIIKVIAGTSLDTSFKAWTKFDKAVRTVGNYRTVVFDDPIIHLVVDDMGGWCSFGTVTETEWPFKGKEFQQRYRAYKQSGEIKDAPKQLTGEHDHMNLKLGLTEKTEPVMIGDKMAPKLLGRADGCETQLAKPHEIEG